MKRSALNSIFFYAVATASHKTTQAEDVTEETHLGFSETTTEQFTTKPAPTLPTRPPTTPEPDMTTTTTTVGSTKAGGLLLAAIAQNRKRIQKLLTNRLLIVSLFNILFRKHLL